MSSISTAQKIGEELSTALGGSVSASAEVEWIGTGDLPSVFPVTELAAASIGAAGQAVAELIAARHGQMPALQVDRRLASFWFAFSVRPQGWDVPPPWDVVAGDYRAKDGWIRLHTNAPHHREAALAVLGVAAEKELVALAVATWAADDLESAIVARGGCAAVMCSIAEWGAHPQGQAVAAEPLLHFHATAAAPRPDLPVPRDRPLQGVRVLDLTRVLAGPVATRFLAGFGASVLRIDPPWWDEPALAPEITLGKRCSRLDLREPEQRARFEHLLTEADVLIHGYRPEASARLGLDAERRQQIRPGLVDVSLDAYGWTGPWAGRRGFDSLVQMSAGIADAGMRRLGKDQPTPLPVQALDHAAGYILAAAAIRGLTRRFESSQGCEARTSLARVAKLLVDAPANPAPAKLEPPEAADFSEGIEHTFWGPAKRLKPPVTVSGAPLRWDLSAGPLGASSADWP